MEMLEWAVLRSGPHKLVPEDVRVGSASLS